MIDFDIVEVAVADLKPNAYNPNQQSVADFDLLVKSIREDGFTLPVVVNNGKSDPSLTNMIIDGEHRWRAAQVLEMETIPVIYKAMDKAGMRVSTIRHNVARGTHDVVMEANVLRELIGDIPAEQLSDQLNIDLVELDVMVGKGVQYDDRKELAHLLEDEKQSELEASGLPEEGAKIVARRHAMIDSPQLLRQADAQKEEAEAYQNVRFELVYSGEQAEFMREQVRKAGGGLKLLLQIKDIAAGAS